MLNSMLAEGTFWIDLGRVADIVTLVAFPLALGGLALALGQLKKTQNAVAAAEYATEDTRRESALRQLLVLLPTLAEIESRLDHAVAEGVPEAVERELANWRQRGSDVQGMLAGRSDLPVNLGHDLRTAIVQSGTAKVRLSRGNVDVAAATEQARADIGTAVAGIFELAGRFKTFVEKEEEKEEND